jgi:hypothetical protein
MRVEAAGAPLLLFISAQARGASFLDPIYPLSSAAGILFSEDRI